MRRMILGICLMLGCQAISYPLVEQRQKERPTAREYLADVKKRRDLGADYGRVARFRLASRKTTYHVGEMVTIDLAMMNVSEVLCSFIN
jgi:hypothetical protein